MVHGARVQKPAARADQSPVAVKEPFRGKTCPPSSPPIFAKHNETKYVRRLNWRNKVENAPFSASNLQQSRPRILHASAGSASIQSQFRAVSHQTSSTQIGHTTRNRIPKQKRLPSGSRSCLLKFQDYLPEGTIALLSSEAICS